MASDALWAASFKCVVKGYQECRFDVKEGEEFKVLKKIVEKGRAFLVVNERGTSADSVTEHIEEPREVPESSVSSIFFRQEQCRVILKQYTLKRAG